MASGPPWIFGLRGTPRDAPENTCASLERAVALGLDGIAYDVRACAGGELVLLADATLDRTSDASGPLAAFDARALHEVDAGAWFSKAFVGQRVAWLTEALALHGNAAGARPQHVIEVHEPATLPLLARRLEEHGRKLSVRVATARRSVALEARDLGLTPLLLLARASEDDCRFVHTERIAAVGARPSAWRALSAAAAWACERFCLAVDEPDELLAACRLPYNALTTTEPRRALATRALVALTPDDRGAYPLQAPELVIASNTALDADGAWSGAWDTCAHIRNPFAFDVRVALELLVRRGAFEAKGLPAFVRLAPGQVESVPFQVRGGSWSPGGDPLLVARYVWGAHDEHALALDAPLTRVREARLSTSTLRLALLKESPRERAGTVTLRRHRGDLLAALEDAGGLSDARIVVSLEGEIRVGTQGVRIALPRDFDARVGGIAFSVGIEGRIVTPRGPRTVTRRWAGGLPDVVTGGAAGRLVCAARG